MSRGIPEQEPQADIPEDEGSMLDPDSPMFAAFAKLAKEKPDSPAVQRVREAIDTLSPALHKLTTSLEDAVLRMGPDPETAVEITRGRLKRSMGRTLSEKRREFIEMGYRLGHAFEPYAEEAKQRRVLIEETKTLGSDWYKLKVIPGPKKISPGAMKRRSNSFHQALPVLDSSIRLEAIETFHEGFSYAGEADRRAFNYLTAINTGSESRHPVKKVLGKISQGTIRLEGRATILLCGFIDTNPDPKTMSDRLTEFFTDPKTHTRLFRTTSIVTAHVMSKAINSYFDNLAGST